MLCGLCQLMQTGPDIFYQGLHQAFEHVQYGMQAMLQ